MRDFLDIDELGKRAMVDQLDQADEGAAGPSSSSLLRALIEDNYVRGLRANLEYTVDYTGESTDKDGNVIVTTKINTKRKGRPYTIEVDYILMKDGDKLRAWDVKTDGVGLVENYRTMFNKIIAQGRVRRPDREDEEEAGRERHVGLAHLHLTRAASPSARRAVWSARCRSILPIARPPRRGSPKIPIPPPSPSCAR